MGRRTARMWSEYAKGTQGNGKEAVQVPETPRPSGPVFLSRIPDTWKSLTGVDVAYHQMLAER